MKIIFFLLAFFVSSLSFSQSDQLIEDDCKAVYPSITEFFERKKCVSDAKKAKAQREVKEKREESARNCLAEQIPDIEKWIQSLMKDLNYDDSMNQVVSKLEKLKVSPEIVPSTNNIKEKVAVLKINTTCKSDFSFLINITEGEDKKLKSFSVWSEDAPRGYSSGFLKQFHIDFASQKEAIKKAQKRLTETKGYETDQNSSHCAPNLSRQERINRLARKGQLRQTSENSYSAGLSSVSFSFTGALISCY
jgi:hypothetical protein